MSLSLICAVRLNGRPSNSTIGRDPAGSWSDGRSWSWMCCKSRPCNPFFTRLALTYTRPSTVDSRWLNKLERVSANVVPARIAESTMAPSAKASVMRD
jgi:hypothetical protein